MKTKYALLSTAIVFLSFIVFVISCKKETLPAPVVTPPTVSNDPSFVEEFDNVGDLVSKGWVFRNNSRPIGEAGWRQGRYESATAAQYKFLAPVAFVGFPAYSADNSPNDFVSCDVSAASDVLPPYTANYSAWLISPALPMKNGDKISFYTKATDDSYYPVYCKDRMQVRANFSDGTANVGAGDTTTGKFTRLLLDINPNYVYNDPASGSGGGYPRTWTKYTITISGLPSAGITNGRFAFRYFGTDAGFYGGSAGANYPTVVGVDQLSFVHQ